MLATHDEFTVEAAVEQYKELKAQKVGFPWFFKKVYSRGDDFVDRFNQACRKSGLPEVRTPRRQQKHSVDDLLSEYQSLIATEKPFPWFYTKFHALPANQQAEFNKACKEAGLPEIESRSNVRWTDDEWRQIAQGIVAGLAANPTAGVTELARSVVEGFPQDRKRKVRFSSDIRRAIAIASQMLTDMIEHPQPHKMTAQQLINEQGERLAKELSDNEILTHFKDRVVAAMKQEELSEEFVNRALELVTPDEVLQYIPAEIFANDSRVKDVIKSNTSDQEIDLFIQTIGIERVMRRLPAANLVSYGATEMVKWWQAFSELVLEQNSSDSQPKQTPPKLPTQHKNGQTKSKTNRVAIYGLLSRQAEELRKRLGPDYKVHVGLESGVRTPASIPSNYDLHVLWSRFVSHAADKQVASRAGEKLIRHFGGLNEMAFKVKDYFDSK